MAVIRVAYADPPYIGQAHKHYSHDPNCAEVEPSELIERLGEFHMWALSCSSPSLRIMLPLCPNDVRVCAWVKPFASFKPNVGLAYAWEPVILYGGRKRTRKQPTVRDWVSANITLERGLSGVKPDYFSNWLFEALNLTRDDELVDLYPGSGAVTAAWEKWRRRLL
jgi:hypothetical protein